MTLKYFLKSFADKPNSVHPALLWMNCELAHLGGSRCERTGGVVVGVRHLTSLPSGADGRRETKHALGHNLRGAHPDLQRVDTLVLGLGLAYRAPARGVEEVELDVALLRGANPDTHRDEPHVPPAGPPLSPAPPSIAPPSHLRLCRAPLTFQSLSEISSVISTLNVSSYCLIALSQIATDACHERA